MVYPKYFKSTDSQRPIIFCPVDITVTAEPNEPTAEVSWAKPFASDNSRWVEVETNFDPGSSFPAGETTEVVYTARDRSGNEKSCSFLVIVMGK